MIKGRKKKEDVIGRRSICSYLSGMVVDIEELLGRDRLDLRLAPEEVIHFFPAVVVRIHHSFHLSEHL